jgi:hypothetical protein
MEKIPVEILNDERLVLLREAHMPDAGEHFRAECEKAGLRVSNARYMQRVEDILLYLMLNESIALAPAFYAPFFDRYLVFRELRAPHPLLAEISVNALRSNSKPALKKLLRFLQGA